MWKSFFFLAAGILFYSQLSAQQTRPRISGSFQNIRAPKFFRQLEAQSPYKFYFDSVQIAEVNINVTAQDELLEKVLERAFQKTELKYSVDKEQNVFITTKYHVFTNLAAGYYKDGKANGVNE